MVGSWKDEEGRAVLDVWDQTLNLTYQKPDERNDQPFIAGIEKRLAKALALTVRREIRYDEKCSDLVDVVKYRRANCLGYALLLYIIGNSIGLTVRGLEVTEQPSGELLTETMHTGSLVELADSKTVMMDMASESLVSKPFIMEKEFMISGNYLELKATNNLLGLHRRIRILDRNGLLACIYADRANTYTKLGRYTKAISDCERAIKLDPKSAGAYVNRGRAYRNLKQDTKAISDYTSAIELDPKCLVAYYNRGHTYWDLGQHSKAASDLLVTTEKAPQLIPAFKRIDETIKRLKELLNKDSYRI